MKMWQSIQYIVIISVLSTVCILIWRQHNKTNNNNNSSNDGIRRVRTLIMNWVINAWYTYYMCFKLFNMIHIITQILFRNKNDYYYKIQRIPIGNECIMYNTLGSHYSCYCYGDVCVALKHALFVVNAGNIYYSIIINILLRRVKIVEAQRSLIVYFNDCSAQRFDREDSNGVTFIIFLRIRNAVLYYARLKRLWWKACR